MTLFLFMLLLGIFPVLVLPLVGAHYQETKGLPRISHGSIDLSRTDLRSIDWIPLNGEWRYYKNAWCIL